MDTRVDCDSCGEPFDAAPVEVPIDGGGRRMQLVCSSCEAVFPIATISPRGVQLRRRLKRAERRGDRDQVVQLRRKLERHVVRASSS